MSSQPQGQPTVDQIIEAIRTVFDPELPVNVYDLGLIYAIEMDGHNNVFLMMTLTSPGCPVAGSLPTEVEGAVRKVAGVRDVIVKMVWDPPWSKEMLSEAAQLELGLM